MYYEWMDGFPLLYDGCYEHNISQARKAVEYYNRLGNDEQVNYWKEYIKQEKQKQREYENLSGFGKFIRKMGWI